MPEVAIDFLVFFSQLLAHLSKPALVIVGILKKVVKELLGKIRPDLPGIFHKFLSCFFQRPLCSCEAKKMPLLEMKDNLNMRTFPRKKTMHSN